MGRTTESTILVVAGNKLRLDVPITGDPAPTVIWTKSEKVQVIYTILPGISLIQPLAKLIQMNGDFEFRNKIMSMA